ncbi:MAG: conjugal transfer protein TraF, partial [Elusimicrobia bacterium]|nr:conjugal transfer protein TraF [Elusimicrobiota bacterium]
SGFGKFNDNIKTSFQPAVDLGLLWDMRETFPSLPMRPRLGVVGRNLNSPGFKNPDRAVTRGERSKFPLNGQGRMGLALSPFKFWHLAMDVDLTDNLTPVDGYKSRYMSVGTELNVFNRPWLNIPLRAGLQKNLSDTGSGASYTAGFGLNFIHVLVDVAGMVSSKTTSVQSEGKSGKGPNNFGGAV